jgi:hypothetical protein
MIPPVVAVSWPYLRYMELLGLPVSVVCFQRMLEHNRREPRTQLKGNLAVLYIVVYVGYRLRQSLADHRQWLGTPGTRQKNAKTCVVPRPSRPDVRGNRLHEFARPDRWQLAGGIRAYQCAHAELPLGVRSDQTCRGRIVHLCRRRSAVLPRASGGSIPHGLSRRLQCQTIQDISTPCGSPGAQWQNL